MIRAALATATVILGLISMIFDSQPASADDTSGLLGDWGGRLVLLIQPTVLLALAM